MVNLKYFVFVFALIATLVQAQNQTGFISIDSGSSDASGYTDETTGITYLSDANFTEFGENAEVSEQLKLQLEDKQLWNLRSFPQGKRNCYTLRPSLGKDVRYLIRARFVYGNYDSKNSAPAFALYLGVDLWDIVDILDARLIQNKEIIYVPLSDYIHVCLVNTGNGAPFVSALELRPLRNETYLSKTGTGLQLAARFDFAPETDREDMRYKDDAYDRLWSPLSASNWQPLKISVEDQNNMTKNIYAVPNAVMSTAYTKNTNSSFMGIQWTNLISPSEYFFFMHFAELVKLGENETRAFNIFINNDLGFGPFSPRYLAHATIYNNLGIKPDPTGTITIWANSTKNSTLPPLINAMEIYVLKELPQLQTNQSDAYIKLMSVEAILDIKTEYGLKRISWQGDPCSPKDYLWDGLNCSYSANGPPRIISLNLSSSGLKGKISSSIAKLTMLQDLDLSNNSLSGTVPEFLADLNFLRVLNLKGNKLTGPIPSTLLERSRNGLSLSVDASVIGNTTSRSSQTSPATDVPSPPSIAHSLLKNKFDIVSFVASLSGVLLYFVL